jgi:hypothetical protein
MLNFHPPEDAEEVTSIVDFGCNVGVWLDAAKKNGIEDVVGIDGDNMRSLLRFAVSQFVSHDLSKPLSLNRKFSLAICVEVAEHISEDKADILVDNIVSHSHTVFFSAAVPGQTGYHHVNEQPHIYWINKFATRGYSVEHLSTILPIAPHDYYRKNALLFTKG